MFTGKPNSEGAEAGGSQVQEQLILHSWTWFQNNSKSKNKELGVVSYTCKHCNTGEGEAEESL